jgi:ribosomal protein S18 acetylase RimI-like enzyme
MVVQLQLASARDAEPIALLSRNLIEAGLGWSWTPARVSRAIDTPDANVLVAITRTNVVGFGIMRYHRFSAHLDLLAVTSAHQRCGLGRRLLHWLEEAATTAGAVYVFAEARALRRGVLAFYDRLGYQAIERLPAYYGGQEEAVRLAKSLRHTILPSAGQTPVGFNAGRQGRSFPPT